MVITLLSPYSATYLFVYILYIEISDVNCRHGLTNSSGLDKFRLLLHSNGWMFAQDGGVKHTIYPIRLALGANARAM